MGFQEGWHAFEYLVCVQAAYYHDWRCLYHECHNKRQWQYDHPDADKVHLDHEHSIAATPDDPVVGRHLVGHADADDA